MRKPGYQIIFSKVICLKAANPNLASVVGTVKHSERARRYRAMRQKRVENIINNIEFKFDYIDRVIERVGYIPFHS